MTKELQNGVISDDDFEKLRVSINALNNALIPPESGDLISVRDVRAGLIADVHTAMTVQVQEVLYEAIGIPYIIYVAVKDTNGTRLTRGVVFSYYEFTHPFGERISDVDWQAVIYESQNKFTIPQTPAWIESLEK